MCITHTTFLNLESQTNVREKEMSKLTLNPTLATLTLVQQEIISHIQKAETREMSKLTLILAQVHNPWCHFAHLQGHSLSPSKWTMEKSVQQLPAGSSTSGGRMCNGFFVNYAIPGCMYTANTLPSKNLS